MVERIKEGTVIITEGRIYALFHETHPTDNNVCRKCDLHHFCMEKGAFQAMSNFCTRGVGRTDAFFLECSPLSSTLVRDITFQQNFLEADASSDEASTNL